MRKVLLSMAMVLAFFVALNTQAQSISTFEDLNLPLDTFWNGSDLSGGFTSGDVFFSNTYDTTYYSWGGFAYSSKKDTMTSGWSNMYSSISGAGDSSHTYAVAFVSQYSGPTSAKLVNITNNAFTGFYINNSTYAYLSMENGDAYAKKFGGSTGDDADWFMLTITGYKDGNLIDTVNFFLADFRFTDNSNDYIIKDWTWVDLSKLGVPDSLSFSLSSSDNGTYGMNTPAYFCLDNLRYSTIESISTSLRTNNITIYPNPSTSSINIDGVDGETEINIYDLKGALVFTKELGSNISILKLDISNFNKGMYIIQLIGNNTISQGRFIKQ